VNTRGEKGMSRPKGFKHTKKTKKRMSKSAKKYFSSLKGIEKIKRMSQKRIGEGNPFYGKTHSVKTKKKFSLFRGGNKHPLFGKSHSIKTKKIISKKLKEFYSIHLNPMQGVKCSEEQKQKSREYMINGGAVYAQQFIRNPSKPQVELYNHIKQIYPTAILNYPIKVFKGKHYSLDVAIPELKIDFEYDGVYWHKGRKVRDFFRDENLIERGWCVVRVFGVNELRGLIK